MKAPTITSCQWCGETFDCRCRWFCAYCGKPDASDYTDRHGIYAGRACNDAHARLARLPIEYEWQPGDEPLEVRF